MDSVDKLDYIISVVMIISAGFILYVTIRMQHLITFIRDNNLQKKWQEWKKDNKGLV
jgi:hypothetical protein